MKRIRLGLAMAILVAVMLVLGAQPAIAQGYWQCDWFGWYCWYVGGVDQNTYFEQSQPANNTVGQ